jgi:hypothetical protein
MFLERPSIADGIGANLRKKINGGGVSYYIASPYVHTFPKFLQNFKQKVKVVYLGQ